MSKDVQHSSINYKKEKVEKLGKICNENLSLKRIIKISKTEVNRDAFF